MSKKSFKIKNSLSLEETSRQSDAAAGESYYDITKGSFASKSAYWSFLESKADLAYQADLTSSNLTTTITENAIIQITGSPIGSFNLHGLVRNNNAKIIHIFNDTNQKMVIKHQSGTEGTASNRINTPTGNDLSIAKKSLVILFYDDNITAWVAVQASGGAGGTSFDQIQTAHGFTLFTPIYHDGTIWQKAQANTPNTLATYVVTDFSTNAFTATKFGVIEAPAHGLTVGEFYYVSGATAGAITITEPLFGYSNPVLYVQDTTNVHMMCYRPSLIGDGNVSDSEIGAVVAFPFITEPAGFLFADGRAVSRSIYIELFNVIGTTYGVGDGSTTFNLPNMKGVFLKGAGTQTIGAKTYTGTLGVSQNDTTAKNGLGISDPGHAHQETYTSAIDGVGTPAHVTSPGGGVDSTILPTGGSLTLGGPLMTVAATTGITLSSTDTETKPANITVGYFIRFAARGAIAGDKIPAGTITAFGGIAANIPSGYILCNGSSVLRSDYPTLFATVGTTWGSADGAHFNLPDFRGVFLRGDGSQTIGGVTYTGTLGTVTKDSFQGFQVGMTVSSTTYYGRAEPVGNAVSSSPNAPYATAQFNSGAIGSTGMVTAVSDGTNGVPRTSFETKPANASVNYIIKY